jgi:hypothetical protein
MNEARTLSEGERQNVANQSLSLRHPWHRVLLDVGSIFSTPVSKSLRHPWHRVLLDVGSIFSTPVSKSLRHYKFRILNTVNSIRFSVQYSESGKVEQHIPQYHCSNLSEA